MRPRVAPRVATCQPKVPSLSLSAPSKNHHAQSKVVLLQPRPELSPHSRETNTWHLTINADQIITDANKAALQWLQVDKPSIIGLRLSDVFGGLQAHIPRRTVGPEIFTNCELLTDRRPDRWVDLHVHPDRHGARVYVRHITELRRQTTHTRDLLQASLDSLSAHVVILDGTGTIVASNLAWQRFAAAGGLTGSPIHGRPSYLSWPQANMIKEDLASVLTGHRKGMRQIYSAQAATGLRWFELRASRLDCGRETHVVVVSEDVTAIKQAEQALGEAAENLLTLQEEERRRISEELHDSTAQHLAAAGLNLMGLRSRVDARGEVLELLERIENSLDEASKELRSLTYLLHPPCLEADGLEATLHRYVAGFGKRTGVKARLRIGQSRDALPFVLQRPVFRVIQEALANVYRHASASRVSVDLKYILGHLHVVVRDNGRGMQGARRSPHQLCEPSCLGVGIPGIRARLRQFGGKLVIKSGRRGTMLHAMVPIVTAPALEA